MDLKDETGLIQIVVLHCLNCGEVVDPLILHHRLSAPPPMKDRARVALKTGLTRSGTTTYDTYPATLTAGIKHDPNVLRNEE